MSFVWLRQAKVQVCRQSAGRVVVGPDLTAATCGRGGVPSPAALPLSMHLSSRAPRPGGAGSGTAVGSRCGSAASGQSVIPGGGTPAAGGVETGRGTVISSTGMFESGLGRCLVCDVGSCRRWGRYARFRVRGPQG